MRDDRPLLSKLTGRYALFIIGLWVAAAAVGNLAVPQLERVVDSHARSFMPTEAPSAIAASAAARLFDQTPSNFYDALTAALDSDPSHVCGDGPVVTTHDGGRRAE